MNIDLSNDRVRETGTDKWRKSTGVRSGGILEGPKVYRVDQLRSACRGAFVYQDPLVESFRWKSPCAVRLNCGRNAAVLQVLGEGACQCRRHGSLLRVVAACASAPVQVPES